METKKKKSQAGKFLLLFFIFILFLAPQSSFADTSVSKNKSFLGPLSATLSSKMGSIKEGLNSLSDQTLAIVTQTKSSFKRKIFSPQHAAVTTPVSSPKIILAQDTVPSPSSEPLKTPSPKTTSVSTVNIENSSLVSEYKLFKTAASSNIYFYDKGSLHHVPDTATLNSLVSAHGEVLEVSPETFGLFRIGEPLETVELPFSSREVSGILSLFRKFATEENVGQDGKPLRSALSDLSIDLEKLKTFVGQNVFAPLRVAPNTAVETALSGAKANIDNIVLDGNSISVSAGNLELPSILKINGVAYTWPSADGSADYVLRTNGSGTLTWAAASGGISSDSIDFDEIVASASFDTNLDISLNSKNIDFGDGKFFLRGTDGLVGIGTTSPTAAYGLTVASASAGIVIKSTGSTASASLAFFPANASSDNKFTIRAGGLSGTGGERLDILNGSNTSLMTISSRGYIGIGTTAPDNALKVVGTASIDGDLYAMNGSSVLLRVDKSNNLVAIGGSTFEGSSLLNISPGNTSYTNGITLARSLVGFSLTNAIVLQEAHNDATQLFVVTGQGRLGTGGAPGSSQFTIRDATAGSATASSFEITSANTIANIASISATAITTGNVFNILVPTSSSFSGAIFVARDTNNLVLASLSSGGRLSLRRNILSHGATSSCTGVGTPSAGCLDLAEEFPTTDLDVQPGHLVSLDNQGTAGSVKKSATSYDDALIGVIATKPGIILGESVYTGHTAETYAPAAGRAIVALAGRVPVKVSEENGAISKGDFLTSSSIPGVAMKATGTGRVAGMALENASNGSVLMFVNLHYRLGSDDLSTQMVDLSAGTIPSISSIMESVLDYLKDSVLTVKRLVADIVTARKGVQTEDTVTGEVYCINVSNGLVVAQKGDCLPASSSGGQSSEPASTAVPEATGTPTTELSTEPVSAREPEGPTESTPEPSMEPVSDTAPESSSEPEPVLAE